MQLLLRTKLTIWYALTLAVILTASGVFWYWLLDRNLNQHLQERMLQFAEGILALEQVHQPAPPYLPVVGGDRCRQLNLYLQQAGQGEYITLLDPNGQAVCRSANLGNNMLPFQPEVHLAAYRGETVFSTSDVVGLGRLRLLNFPLHLDRNLVGIVQVGTDLRELSATMQHLAWILLTFSPLALLAITCGGWLLAGRALAPVDRLTKAMRRINAGNLDQRLAVDAESEEIVRLADTFNEMLARLNDSFARIKQFSGDASHELRTPLTILKGETEVALRWAKTSDEYRNVLVSNMDEIRRMERIIEDLLMLAKSDSGEIQVQKKELSLSDLVQELYLQARTLSEAKHLEINLRLEVDYEILIKGDELRLRQMFLNLITNAVKYTPEGGRVDIILELHGEHAVVTISDTGIGIPKDHLPHIFDRFYRIDEARNREAGGAGLGLAIVKWIVDAHAGEINVVSTVGAGSAFTVSLPIDGPEKPTRISIR